MGLDPTSIGRYVVLGPLGQGAMGTVYLAEDPVLKRGVAVKVVNAGQLGKEEALRRFRREAEISARLNHPNVITIFDVGDEPKLGPFMAMEFIEGETLEELLAAGPLDPSKVMEVLVQAGEALDAAHALGIVHRDVKPANLMVAKDGRVKLMDFGIAREEEKPHTTEALLCTPGFAAPELLDGAPASPASDRWALAITAYQCLFRSNPFEGENLSVVLYNVAHRAPSFQPDMSPVLEGVFRKALSRLPADRFPDIPSFLEALAGALPLEEAVRRRLQAYLARDPVAPLPSKAPTQAPFRNSPIGPRALWAAGLLVLALLAYLGMREGLLFGRTLRLESVPDGGDVFVDGRRMGRTPLLELRVPPWAEQIRVQKANHRPFIHDLKDGESGLRFHLEPVTFSVDVRSDPEGARVYLDGKEVGETPLLGLQVPEGGDHLLMLMAEGRESWAAPIGPSRRPPERIQLRISPRKGP